MSLDLGNIPLEPVRIRGAFVCLRWVKVTTSEKARWV